MTIEEIDWQNMGTRPDDTTTVLCWRDAEQEWFAGWWDDEAFAWFDCATGGIVEGVTHWVHVRGPQS